MGCADLCFHFGLVSVTEGLEHSLALWADLGALTLESAGCSWWGREEQGLWPSCVECLQGGGPEGCCFAPSSSCQLRCKPCAPRSLLAAVALVRRGPSSYRQMFNVLDART